MIAGVTLVALFGTVTTIFESSSRRQNEKKTASQQQKVLQDIERTLHPINSVSVFYNFQLSRNYIPAYDYVQDTMSRLSKISADTGPFEIHKSLNFNKAFGAIHVNPSSIDLGGRPENFDVSFLSPLWPHGNNAFIAMALSQFHPSIFLLKKPVDPKTFSPIIGLYEGSADLIMPNISLAELKEINFNYKDQTVGLLQREMLDSRSWHSDGKISSLLDLAGSQIIITAGTGDIDGCKGRLGLLTSELEMRMFNLDFGAGLSFWFNPKLLMRTVEQNGCVQYSFIFPSDYENMLAQMSNDSD